MRATLTNQGSLDDDFRAGLLERLACRCLCRRFAVLHETCRQGPEAVAGLDGSPAQQDRVFPGTDTPHHQAWILVVDVPAIVAYKRRGSVSPGGTRWLTGAAQRGQYRITGKVARRRTWQGSSRSVALRRPGRPSYNGRSQAGLSQGFRRLAKIPITELGRSPALRRGRVLGCS